MFINVEETGFPDDAIRTRMRLYLETSNVSDEVLIGEMNVGMKTESELGTGKHPARQH